jgi:hypothetical protein
MSIAYKFFKKEVLEEGQNLGIAHPHLMPRSLCSASIENLK